MEIRSATPRDLGVLVELLGELGYPAAPGAVRERLRRILAAPDAGVLLAASGKEVAGLIGFQLIESLEREAPQCRITTLVTAAARRRSGVASGLLAAVEAVAAARGCDRLEVTTRPTREDALAFYLGAGFAERPRRMVKGLRAEAAS
jgi:GNAT superfamily N-acetyltransferase